MLSQSQKEAVDEQMFIKLKKWKKPELELVTTCNTINTWLSDKYGFEATIEDLQESFNANYVAKGFYKLKESGFLDKKQRYPYFRYTKVKNLPKAI